MVTLYIYNIQEAVDELYGINANLVNKLDLCSLLIYYIHERHLVPLSPMLDSVYKVLTLDINFNLVKIYLTSFFKLLDMVISMIRTDTSKMRSAILIGIKVVSRDLYLFLE